MKTTVKLILVVFVFTSNIIPQTWRTIGCNWTDLNFPGGFAYSMFYDKPNDAIYAGCYGNLYKLDLNTLAWTWVDADPDSGILANAKIISICKDKTGCIYAGCDSNTPSYYSTDGGQKWRQIMDFSFSINSVFCITEAPDGSIWFGTNRGLIVSRDHGYTYTAFANMKKSISAIMFDSNGNVYLGTSGGLYKSTNGGNDWAQVNLPYPGSSVLAIGMNSKGHIFAGTSTYLYHSVDAGISWESLSPNGSMGGAATVKEITFDNNDNLVVNAILLMISYDSGHYFYQINPYLNTPNPTSIQPKGIVLDTKNRIFTMNTFKAPYILMGQIVPTIIENERLYVPLNFVLNQNYPNPFNPSTTIKFSIPTSPEPSPYQGEGLRERLVTLKIYDLLGREVTTLVNEEKAPGNYEVTFNVETRRGESLSSGVYFYTLSTNGFFQSKKMLLMK